MKTNTQPIEAIIIESTTVTTRQGKALLFKGWSETSSTVLSVWTDANKPSPFLAGKKVGDSMRVIPESRTVTDLHGKTTSTTYFTPIPSA